MIGPGVPVPGSIPDYVPDSVNAIVGVLTGTVADVQHWQDGNTLNIQEAAATPGQNVEFPFVGVRSIRRVAAAVQYAGSALHYVNFQLWEYIMEDWVTVLTFPDALGINLRYAYIPENGKRFFDSSGNAKARLYHPVGGNAAHNTTVDYIALVP